MGWFNKIFGLPEKNDSFIKKDDSFIEIPIDKKIAKKYGWDKSDEEVICKINEFELKLTKIKSVI